MDKKTVIKKTMDGNEAAAYVSYAFTEVAAIYPITPSSPMAEHVDRWAANGRKNVFGQEVKLVEMQSEAGAVSAMHGAMEAGVLTSSYTSSQGLLLMVPTMFRIAGNLKSGVIHVAARSVASHAYSIFAEHSDVMACRQTGFGILASASVQEAMDLGAVAHLASIKGSLPFMHFFDGFRTSHEIQKIDLLDYDDLKGLIDQEALRNFRKNALNPEHPVIRIAGQTPETYFQSREVVNTFYESLPQTVEYCMDQINQLTGRDYKLFNYYGSPDAEYIVVAMGSVSGTIKETLEYLNKKSMKVGFLQVRLFRPFSFKHMLEAIPKTVKRVAVLDRTKEPGAVGEPLFEDVCAAFNENSHLNPLIIGGRFGIGGKNTDPAQILASFENLMGENPQNHFTVGIEDDVTHTSLVVGPRLESTPTSTISCKFWGLGSDGTVGANKSTIKIIGDHTEKYVQAYFEYDGKKSGGITKSHLRFGDQPIDSAYYIDQADFVACHNSSYLRKYDMFSDLKAGGSFLLNCTWQEEELHEHLPQELKKYIAEKNISLYIINATNIAMKMGLGSRTNTILQAAFFKITNIIPIDEAVSYMKEFALKTYGAKGESIVELNYTAIEKGIEEVKKVFVPAEWACCACEDMPSDPKLPAFVRNEMIPVIRQKGNSLKVSTFVERPDGSMPVGSSKYEKRCIGVEIPSWSPDKCIQCNQCSFVCPHAAIRPFLLNSEEAEKAPSGFKKATAKGKDMNGYEYAIQVDPEDCVGCGSCAHICPAKEKALSMEAFETQIKETKNWEYARSLSPKANPIGVGSVKGSQFQQPLLEFPGACPGCGETPYAKLITQLYGDRMYIATATGCPLVWATDYPTFPYTTNEDGHGPTMANSLFENNGEFGLGMALGVTQMRKRMKDMAGELMELTNDKGVAEAIENWLEKAEDGNASKEAGIALRSKLVQAQAEGHENQLISFLVDNSEHLSKKSVWIFGGDGWAYDIGYGGLDHVIAMGEDVNILVLDTEVYSNTGGQASKSTSKGAVAQFAAAGRKSKKKDLGKMAMCYGNVYVAQVAMGANQAQLLKAVQEAEAYPGPSLIIAYAPCISHGLACGMHAVQSEMKRAVEAGYWHLYRYNPLLKKEGKNPFHSDSAEPSRDLREFLRGENRFASLEKSFPEEAARLLAEAEVDAKEKYQDYKMISEGGPIK